VTASRVEMKSARLVNKERDACSRAAAYALCNGWSAAQPTNGNESEYAGFSFSLGFLRFLLSVQCVRSSNSSTSRAAAVGEGGVR